MTINHPSEKLLNLRYDMADQYLHRRPGELGDLAYVAAVVHDPEATESQVHEAVTAFVDSHRSGVWLRSARWGLLQAYLADDPEYATDRAAWEERTGKSVEDFARSFRRASRMMDPLIDLVEDRVLTIERSLRHGGYNPAEFDVESLADYCYRWDPTKELYRRRKDQAECLFLIEGAQRKPADAA